MARQRVVHTPQKTRSLEQMEEEWGHLVEERLKLIRKGKEA